MAKTPLIEQKIPLRAMGAALIALMLFFVWLTYAFFNQKFVDSVPVTVDAAKIGLQLPKNAEVKLLGMDVGQVRDFKVQKDGVKIKVAMKPSTIKRVPRGVTAKIVPKTLFGEKYIDLIPPKQSSDATLQAGDTIQKAKVPIEVETLLNNLYPLLEAVQPAELSYTLTAVSDALSGRGTELGDTLVTLNDYLKKINPDVPQLVDDLVKLGTVSDAYADAMPDLGRLLKNLVVTGDTIVAKKAQLQAFFIQGAQLSDTATSFLNANGDNLIGLAKETRPVLDVVSDYSTTFPCFFKQIDPLIDRIDSAFRQQKLHINVTVVGQAPDGYKSNENGTIPSRAEIAKHKEADPACQPLTDKSGKPYSHDNPTPVPPFEVYKLLGIKDDHNGKFCAKNDSSPACKPDPKLGRAAVQSLIDMVQPSAGGVDSPEQRTKINKLLGTAYGTKPTKMPDMASLMVSPILRGSEVSVSETR